MTTVETVRAVVTADASQYNREIGGAQGKMSGLAANAGKAALAVGAAFTAAAGVIAVKSVTAFAGFETSMNEVKTLMPDLTEEAFAAMGDDVKNFGKEFGVLSDESIPALYQAISAGVPAGNVFDFMETAQKAARGGVTDLETAVDGISSVMNAYGEDVVSATEASDLMFTAVKLGKTDFSQLSAGLFQVVPAAAAMGIGFGDVTASLATLTAQGVPTRVATTQMRGALVELGKDGSKAATAFESIAGQSFPDFIAAGGDVAGAVRIMGTAAEEGGTSIMNLFGSIEGGQAIQALAADIEGFESNVAAMGDSTGATETAFEQMDQGLSASMDKIKANAEVLMIEIGEKLAPVVAKAMDWIVLHFDDFKAAGKKAFETIVDVAKKMKPKVVAAFKAIKEQLDKLQPAIDAVVGFVKDLAAAFKEGGLSGALDMVREKLRPITDWMERNQPILAGVAAAIGTVLVAAFVSWAVSAAAAAAATLLAIAPIVAITAAVAGLVAGLVWAYQNVDWFRVAVDELVKFIKNNWKPTFDKMKDAVVAMFDVVRPMVENFVGIFVDVVQFFKALFTGDWARVWEEAKSILSGVLTAIVDQFTALPRLAWAALSGAFPTLWTGIKGWVSDKATALATEMISWKDAVVGFVTGLPGAIAEKARGMFDGIKEAFKSAVNWIIGKWNAIGFTLPQMEIDIPMDGMGPHRFGGQTFNVPPIEPLAAGGIVTRPTLAMIGEGGESEAVIPLSRLSSMMGGGGSSVNNNEITINMPPGSDGADVVRALQSYARSNGGTVPILTGQL